MESIATKNRNVSLYPPYVLCSCVRQTVHNMTRLVVGCITDTTIGVRVLQ
jgi:hypothetical protein